MKCPPCCPSAAVGGAGAAGAAVGPGQDGDHVHALPGVLQRPDKASPPLQGLRLREYPTSAPPAPRLPTSSPASTSAAPGEAGPARPPLYGCGAEAEAKQCSGHSPK